MAHHGPYYGFLYGYFTCLNFKVFLTATSTLKKRKRVLFITWKVPKVHWQLATGKRLPSPEVWDILNSLLQGDLGQAASMQSKAEEVPGKFQGGKLNPTNDFWSAKSPSYPTQNKGGYLQSFFLCRKLEFIKSLRFL